MRGRGGSRLGQPPSKPKGAREGHPLEPEDSIPAYEPASISLHPLSSTARRVGHTLPLSPLTWP